MGKPGNPEEYVAVQVGEWGRRYGTIYIPREIWSHLRPASREFSFYPPKQGRFRIEFDVPVRCLKDQL